MMMICREQDGKSDWERGRLGEWNAYPILENTWGDLRVQNPDKFSAKEISIPGQGIATASRSYQEGQEGWLQTNRVTFSGQPEGVRFSWCVETILITDETKSYSGGVTVGWGPKCGWVEWCDSSGKWKHFGEATDQSRNIIRMSHSINVRFSPMWRARVHLEKIAKPSLDVPIADLDAARDLLALRDVLPGQRRKALMHWVTTHHRLKPAGGLTEVEGHLRGEAVEIKVDDFLIDIEPAPEMVSKFDQWKESRSKRGLTRKRRRKKTVTKRTSRQKAH